MAAWTLHWKVFFADQEYLPTDAISAVYPDILIFTSLADLAYVYESSGQDYHEYTRPNLFVNQFNMFDNVAAGHPIQVGEFAVIQNNTDVATDDADWSAPRK